jgi:Ser/Thr protein kinase RdoA (MazF antagonist)
VYIALLDANAADPLAAMAALLAGYEAKLALLPGERRALRTLAAGRLALSLSMGAYSAARQPDNADYLLGTQANGWRLLRLLAGLSDEAFLAAVGAGPAAEPGVAPLA